MKNLIDFDDDPLPQLCKPTPPATNNSLYGVIKRKCFAVEVSGVVESSGESLQSGTLIQIIPGFWGDECLFKIRNFTKWLEKYKATIYKCKKTDYIAISGELWPYLLAFNNDARLLKLVENINRTEFDLDILKLGSEIRIRGPPGNVDKYYEYIVTYNGLVKEISATGYYVGLQLKNDRVPLTSDLKCLSRYYRFGGIGIVVQIDWIMLNLYTEEERLPEQLKKTTNGAILKLGNVPPEPSGETEFNADGAIEISEPESIPNTRQILQSDPPPEPSGETEFNANEVIKISEPKIIPNTLQILQNDFIEYMLNPNDWRKNDERHLVSSSPLNKQTKNEIGATSEQRDRKLEFSRETKTNYNALKTEFNNTADEAVKISETLTRTLSIGSKFSKKTFGWITNIENHDVPTPSINEHLKNINETTAVSKYRKQSPKTLYDTTINYDDKIESITNDEGAMRNTEKTKCGYCSITVEIGDGFTLRECTHSFCTACIRFHVNEYNSKESEIRCPYKKNYQCNFSLQNTEIIDFRGEAIYNNISGNRLKKFESNVPDLCEVYKILDIINDHKPRVPPTNLQPKIPYETNSLSKKFEQSPKTSCHTTLNYTAEIESANNADGAVKNAEKTKCDFCRITVEIGDGIILRECLHSFCADCIRGHVNQNSKCSKIRCPYKQDYACEFELQDVEIKDLGGEKIYNTIVENRLKEFMATEPNARWCTNKDCENVWVSQRDIHQQNERCPKCNANFCLICQNAHEPDGRHENKPIKTFFGKIKEKITGTQKNMPDNGP